VLNMGESKAVSKEIPENVTVHHGSRTTGDITEEGRREIARSVLVPEEDYRVVQLLYSLETYKDNRGMKNYVLYVDKMYGDDKRTKSRVTEVKGSQDKRGIVRAEGSEIGQFCRRFTESGDPTQYWK